MSTYMISEARALLNDVARLTAGRSDKDAIKHGEKQIAEYAKLCLAVFSMSPNVLIKGGKAYDILALSPESPASLSEELRLMSRQSGSDIKSANVFLPLKSGFSKNENHNELYDILLGHSFYKFCDVDENARNAFFKFKKASSMPLAEGQINDDWKRALFYGGVACLFVRLNAWVKAYPKYISKKKAALKCVIGHLEKTIAKIEGTDLDYGLIDVGADAYYRSLMEPHSGPVAADVYLDDPGGSISERLKQTLAGYSKAFSDLEESHDDGLVNDAGGKRNGSKEVSRRLYGMCLDMLVTDQNGHEAIEAIRAELKAYEGVVRDVVAILDKDGINTPAAERSAKEIANKISLFRKKRADSDASFHDFIF